MPIGAPSGHGLRSRVGQGAEFSGFWPPRAALTSAVQGSEAEPQAQRCLPAARHAGPRPAFPFPPEIPVPPRQHRGWIRLRMGGYNRRMRGPGNTEGGGKVTVNTNSSAILGQWECPATAALAAPADNRVGDTSG